MEIFMHIDSLFLWIVLQDTHPLEEIIQVWESWIGIFMIR